MAADEIYARVLELLPPGPQEAAYASLPLERRQQAGQRALQRSANLEAIAHLTKGLEVLHTLPDSLERIWQELAVQTTRGPALMAVKDFGAQEVEHTYRRAHVLSRQVEAGPVLVPVLAGLWAFYLVRAVLQTAQEVGYELSTLAERTQDPVISRGSSCGGNRRMMRWTQRPACTGCSRPHAISRPNPGSCGQR
jgi:hypothetical protein